MKVNAIHNIIWKLANSKWGVQGIDTQTQLSCLLLLSCRIRLPARKLNPARAASNQRTWTVYTYWPVWPLLTSGRLLHVACNAHEKQQTPDTNCSITNQLLQIEVAEELYAHSHAAGLVCKRQQTAALERQPDRRASLRQNMNGGDRVFAGWIWRGVALLGNYKPTARMSGSCGNSDEEMGLSRRRPVGSLRLRGALPTSSHAVY